MNPQNILALVSDLYCQLQALAAENEQLRAALADVQQDEPAVLV